MIWSVMRLKPVYGWYCLELKDGGLLPQHGVIGHKWATEWIGEHESDARQHQRYSLRAIHGERLILACAPGLPEN